MQSAIGRITWKRGRMCTRATVLPFLALESGATKASLGRLQGVHTEEQKNETSAGLGCLRGVHTGQQGNESWLGTPTGLRPHCRAEQRELAWEAYDAFTPCADGSIAQVYRPSTRCIWLLSDPLKKCGLSGVLCIPPGCSEWRRPSNLSALGPLRSTTCGIVFRWWTWPVQKKHRTWKSHWCWRLCRWCVGECGLWWRRDDSNGDEICLVWEIWRVPSWG